jgi:hypothetical protein
MSDYNNMPEKYGRARRASTWKEVVKEKIRFLLKDGGEN